MAKQNGTTLGVYVGGVLVAASTSANLDMSVDEITITSKDSLGKKEILPGTSSWSVSGDFLDDLASSNYEFADFHTLYKNKTQVQVRISTQVAGTTYYMGFAYLTSVSRAMPMEDAVTGSYTFTGTGLLALKTLT
jgi:TP901-1 family phage major tail protein